MVSDERLVYPYHPVTPTKRRSQTMLCHLRHFGFWAPFSSSLPPLQQQLPGFDASTNAFANGFLTLQGRYMTEEIPRTLI